MNTFDNFSKGRLSLIDEEIFFNNLEWNKHIKFDGVELKHIITSKQTNGQFSYHLVRIAANKEIGLHTHPTQLETHEVIKGNGICINSGKEIIYSRGTVSIFPIGVEHKVVAGKNGLFIFAKFFPALC